MIRRVLIAVAVLFALIVVSVAWLEVAGSQREEQAALDVIAPGMSRDMAEARLADKNIKLAYFGAIRNGKIAQDASCGYHYFEKSRRLYGYTRTVLIVRFEGNVVKSFEVRRVTEKDADICD